MNKELLLKVLQLDSIINILKWEERMMIHFQIQDRTDSTTENIEKLSQWIKLNKWIPPEMKYGQDRLLYFENEPGEWLSIEDINHTDLPTIKK